MSKPFKTYSMTPDNSASKHLPDKFFQNRTPRSNSQSLAKQNSYSAIDTQLKPQQALKMRLRRIVGSDKISLPTVTQADSQQQSKADQTKNNLNSEYTYSQTTHSVTNLKLLTHPGLDGICQDWWTRNINSMLKTPNNKSGQQKGFSLPKQFDISKNPNRTETWTMTRNRAITASNEIGIIQKSDLIALEESVNHNKGMEKLTPSIRKVLGKDSHAPARVFTFIKNSPANKNVFNAEGSTSILNSTNGFAGEHSLNMKSKKTVLEMMQEKVLDSLSKSSYSTKATNRVRNRHASPDHPRLQPLEITNNFFLPSPKMYTAVSTNESSRDKCIVPIHKAISSPNMDKSTVNEKNGIAMTESASDKKITKMPRYFVSNIYMARIEKEALKEMRKKQKVQEGVKTNKAVIPEDLESSPLQFTQGAKNPLLDDCESERNSKQKKAPNQAAIDRALRSIGSQFRKKLVRLLNKMKLLKITPKDLLANEHIFSQVPYEKPGSKKLIEAARVGDLGAVQEIFEDYPRFIVHDFDHVNQTALHWAARKGFSDIVRILVRKGADVNAKDIVGRTPLFFALKYNHVVVVRILLASRADPWSSKDYNYKQLSKMNSEVNYYLARARQLHILMKMTVPSKREALWEKEGLRLVIGLNFNIDEGL